MSKCRSRPACRLSKDETHHLTRAGCKKLFRTGSKGTDSVVNALLDPAVREASGDLGMKIPPRERSRRRGIEDDSQTPFGPPLALTTRAQLKAAVRLDNGS